MRAKHWYDIQNATSDDATILMYDEIGGWGIEASQFCKDLATVTAKNITLKMNSPGGSVFDGCTIHNALKDHPASITVQIDGLAASIASVVAMAGDKITMAKNAMMMIHCAWSGVYGNAAEMTKTAAVLAKIDGTLVDTYAERTGMGKRAIKQMMDDETWMTSDEALRAGFCDSVGTQTDAKASFDLSKYNNTPKAALVLYAMKEEPPTNERDLEAILRDAGISKKDALTAVASLKNEARRDSEVNTAIEQFKSLAESIRKP